MTFAAAVVAGHGLVGAVMDDADVLQFHGIFVHFRFDHMNADFVDNDVEERDGFVQLKGVLNNLGVVESRSKRPFLLPLQWKLRPAMMLTIGEHLHDKIRRSKFEDR